MVPPPPPPRPEVLLLQEVDVGTEDRTSVPAGEGEGAGGFFRLCSDATLLLASSCTTTMRGMYRVACVVR